MAGLQPRCCEVQAQAEGYQCEPADDLYQRAMLLDCAGDGAHAHRRAQRDEAVTQHRAQACRDAAPEPALYRALHAQHIDGADGCRNKYADDETGRNDKQVGDQLHAGLVVVVASSAPPRERNSGAFNSFLTR